MFTLHTIRDGIHIDRHFIDRESMGDGVFHANLVGDVIIGVTFPEDR